MKILNITERLNLISSACDRAFNEIDGLEQLDKFTLLMDIDLAVEKLSLDLERLLEADGFNFVHDIAGIVNHIDRQNKTFLQGWTPRHTAQ